MARHTKSLIVYFKAEAALIAAIEIYNKPDFAYREETFAILAINAWELLLKAKILAVNNNKARSLYVLESHTKANGTPGTRLFPKKNRAGNCQTIGLPAAITFLESNPKTRLPAEVRGNIYALAEIRDNAIHFVNAQFALKKAVLEIGTACVKNFVALAKRWFNQDLSRYNLYLMPIGFLASPSATAVSIGGDEARLVAFLRNLVAAQNTTTATSSSGYHIALELNLSFKRSMTDATSTFSLTKDPAAPHIYVTEDDIRLKYPWDYRELIVHCRNRYTDFKENTYFHTMRRPLLADARYARSRFLDPGNPKSQKKRFYNANILIEFDKHFTRGK